MMEKLFSRNLPLKIRGYPCSFEWAIARLNRPSRCGTRSKNLKKFNFQFFIFRIFFPWRKTFLGNFFGRTFYPIEMLSSEPSLKKIGSVVIALGGGTSNNLVLNFFLFPLFSTFSPWWKNFFPETYPSKFVAIHALSYQLPLIQIGRAVEAPEAKLGKN